MPQKKQVTLAEMKVGIFVTVALLLLAALILQQSWGISWFSKQVKAVTYLPDVGGLKSGAPVWLAGMEIGRVRKVTIVPPEVFPGNAQIYRQIAEAKKAIEATDTRLPSAKKQIEDLQEHIRTLKTDVRIVEVQLEIRPEYLNRISRDSEVSIDSRGLIGDSFINISPGTYSELPQKRGDYYLIESLDRPGFREIMTGANDVVANFGVLSEQFKNIVMKLNPDKIGSGVQGTLQDVQSTVKQANQTFSRATVLIDELHSGKGTIGRLTSDPELYLRLTESLEKFNQIADNIQNGQGTLGKLVNDPALFNSANETLKKAELVMDRIEKGEGTLGKLSKDAELYEKSKTALERFASLAERIENGEGTMGKLLKDPGLYNNLEQSSAEISKLLYDLRQDPKKYLTIRFRIF
ncbi:MAG: ABC-type transport system involved in resistance to organic solvent, periplasmic component [Acidobacteria bacterium]|nr:ABC-type transport system involved in resistance to organic solvent, periplasmic component [Acidobacteriota bacterium]